MMYIISSVRFCSVTLRRSLFSFVKLVCASLLLCSFAAASAANRAAPVDGYKIIHVYPHDPSAFTQGLIYLDGLLYEGTGLKGRSSIRAVDLKSGKVLQHFDLPSQYFGEGLTNWGSTLVELTWQAHEGFVYDRFTLRLLRTFNYSGEGWGLTHDTRSLILSDGTAYLRFLDPRTFAQIGRIRVTDDGKPVDNLNELEYIHGEIYANIWNTNRIARISPRTGNVIRWIDLTGLLPPDETDEVRDDNAVLNGIAYDEKGDRLFVTGKLWPKLFEIEEVPAQKK
jgi:glutaminyl-peptide cyclotransferase